MGHKGVSKRKPKKNRPFSSADINGSANANPGKGMTVQSLVKDNRASPNTGGLRPSAGSNKKNIKGH